MTIKFDIDTTNQAEAILRYVLSDGDLEEAIECGKIYPESFEKLLNNTKSAKFWGYTIGRKLSGKTLAKIISSCALKESFLLDFFDCLTTEKLAEIFNEERLSLGTIYKYLKERADADRAQDILYKMANRLYFKRLAEILTYGASDAALTANATYTGINRFRDLNLNGYTYTADGQPHIIIARDVYIPSGSVLSKTASNPVNQPSSGDPGSPGYYILDTDKYPKGGGGGNSWVPLPYGGGGGGGGIDGPGGIGYQNGGPGGGALLLVLRDTIQIAVGLYYSVIDWYLVNVLGKTPTDTVAIQNVRASTGGRGGRSNVGASGGLGGNGGGGLQIFCRNLYNYGTIAANGANGANGVGSPYIFSGGGGGGGGAGGLIYIVAHGIRNAGTVQSRGGSGGKGGDGDPLNGDGGGGGGGGSGGIIYLFYSKEASSISGTFDVSGGSGGAGGSAGYPGTSGGAGQSGIVRLYSY